MYIIIFHLYEYHVRLASWLAVFCGKNCNIGHYTQNVSIPAMLIGTFDFYQSISLHWLWPSRGSQGQHKANLLASFSCILFNWSGWNLIWFWSNSSRISWCYFWVRVNEIREITAVLLSVSTNLTIGMHSDDYESIWPNTGMMVDTFELYTFDTSLIYLDLKSWTLLMQFRKTKCTVGLYSDIYRLISFKLGMMIRPLSFTS